MKLVRRPVSWADDYSMLFIDQPVGTGYSYVTRLQDNDEHGATDMEDLDQIITSRLKEELQEDQQKEQELFTDLAGKDFIFKSAASREEKIKKHTPLYSMGYVKDQRGVAADLLNFLDQFYQRYPEQKKADLYITGESYAGKYVPAMAHAIMESNKGYQRGQDKEKDMSGDAAGFGAKADRGLIPLKGIALGNSLTDPISQVQIHADHAYYLGLVTEAQASQMRELQDQSVREAYRGRFLASNQARLGAFDVFRNVTGGLNWYDIRKGPIPNDWSRMEAFMNLAHVKDALNVYGPRSAFLIEHGASKKEIQQIEEGRARTKYSKDPLVYETMVGDIMRSTAWMVSSLLEQGIEVLAYQGIFDFRDAVAGSTDWIEGLEWHGQQDFKSAERELWMVNERLAGYVRRALGLTWVTILGAGHLAPMDQDVNSLVMIQSLVEGMKLQSVSVEENSRRLAMHVL
ncbi:hypothetical protein BGZ51_009473 [Haplosporangium sp. Z 767]|nr:hypothetical protein BGZ51_009473 [Haplosporangium sp. Z 767]